MKKYIISFGVTIGTIALLFFIGNTFHISLLSVQWIYVNEPENFQMEAKGGLIPVAVGLILGFITDYVLSEKEKSSVISYSEGKGSFMGDPFFICDLGKNVR